MVSYYSNEQEDGRRRDDEWVHPNLGSPCCDGKDL
jgi:hypothetical protein